jgi:hypothetical protein
MPCGFSKTSDLIPLPVSELPRQLNADHKIHLTSLPYEWDCIFRKVAQIPYLARFSLFHCGAGCWQYIELGTLARRPIGLRLGIIVAGV